MCSICHISETLSKPAFAIDEVEELPATRTQLKKWQNQKTSVLQKKLKRNVEQASKAHWNQLHMIVLIFEK